MLSLNIDNFSSGGHPDITHLKTNVHTQAVGLNSIIVLQPIDHLLAKEQRKGPTLEWVREIASLILNPDADSQN